MLCKLKAYGFQDLLLQGNLKKYQTMNIWNKSVNYGDKTSITVNGTDIVESDNLELLGVTIDCGLNFNSSRSAERSEFIFSSRAQCVNRVWVLASCKLAALIFTCIYPMVSAMTSYSSWRHGAFLFLGNIRLKDQSIHQELSFHRLQNNVYYRWISSISHANRTANTRTPNCQSSQGKIWHRKILWSENADLKFNGASNKDGDGINKQRSRGNITQWISNAKVLWEQMEAILDN